jgi:methylmalonyl-CoA/ethylmalonyl-CoA epimerase
MESPSGKQPQRKVDRMKFDHIGVVVADIGEGRQMLHALFGIQNWTEMFEDPVIGVFVQFGIGSDGPCYELIAPRGEKSPVSVALRTGKGILNHVAYLVSDLESAGKGLREAGWMPVAEAQPAVAYNGRTVQFFMSPLRFIVELIESPEHQHSFATDSLQP